MTKHLKFGGSSHPRTMQCSAWQFLSKDLPKSDTSSPYAAEGTMLHDWMEKLVGVYDNAEDAIAAVEEVTK